eukprot:CAMPEP_0174886776 /NCGR_PEP_ID=MMETSP0167-20121228/2015_1 /TAXON_ID=38298 /ORGANISM="Rhodella maculata, Strain CCMP736" /LENGTH=120 /DNA_ID=CAMNT_0016122941 /DNA_START=135 /DNA_END=495 /DNA_ORIENTATION=-
MPSDDENGERSQQKLKAPLFLHQASRLKKSTRRYRGFRRVKHDHEEPNSAYSTTGSVQIPDIPQGPAPSGGGSSGVIGCSASCRGRGSAAGGLGGNGSSKGQGGLTSDRGGSSAGSSAGS